MSSWTGKRSNVHYKKTGEPTFLIKFKTQVGFKNDHGLSEKFAAMPKATVADSEDREDEKPQIVQLEPGDISKEEFETLNNEKEVVSKEEEKADEKIIFRKPNCKRTSNDDLFKSTTKRSKLKTSENPTKSSAKLKPQKQNRKLLSFDDEDE